MLSTERSQYEKWTPKSINHLSGRPITATEAASYGLVAKVFPVETLVEEAVKTADHIAGLSQVDIYADDYKQHGQSLFKKSQFFVMIMTL